MTISDLEKELGLEVLTEWGAISPERLREAETASQARGISLEKILLTEYGIPKYLLIQALSKHYNCSFIEYDERLPIPPELLEGLEAEVLSRSLWMPVIRCDDGTVVIATSNPESPAVREEARKYLRAENYEFRVALEEDIRWFIQDFLHAKPGLLIGTERTGLAFWRTTMAQWRTRMACYRTDLASARTGLAFLRWGLGTVAIANTLLKNRNVSSAPYMFLLILIVGLAICSYGLPIYLKVRRSRISPPGNQTLAEVTAATLIFLENYHFIEDTGVRPETKGTMLARMSDFLADHCTILYPSPSSRVRPWVTMPRSPNSSPWSPVITQTVFSS